MYRPWRCTCAAQRVTRQPSVLPGFRPVGLAAWSIKIVLAALVFKVLAEAANSFSRTVREGRRHVVGLTSPLSRNRAAEELFVKIFFAKFRWWQGRAARGKAKGQKLHSRRPVR